VLLSVRVPRNDDDGVGRSTKICFDNLIINSLLLRFRPLTFCFQADLRVRHRDETKNVTRLTMENVSSFGW
jgi:hypothetical protein